MLTKDSQAPGQARGDAVRFVYRNCRPRAGASLARTSSGRLCGSLTAVAMAGMAWLASVRCSTICPMLSQVNHWNVIGQRLDIQVVAPACVDLHGRSSNFVALLPQFGATNGIVVDPAWSVIEPLEDALLDAGYGFSCIALDDICDDASMIEMLTDWGWNGIGDKPTWL